MVKSKTDTLYRERERERARQHCKTIYSSCHNQLHVCLPVFHKAFSAVPRAPCSSVLAAQWSHAGSAQSSTCPQLCPSLVPVSI